MDSEPKELELANDASKMEALLYQFIKLYDRLTVEHALITERELKIVTKLEKLDQTLIGLNKKLGKLDELGPQLTTTVTKTINTAVSDNWKKLSENIAANAERRIAEICRDLNNASSNILIMVNEYRTMKRSFNWKVWTIIFLVGLLVGIGSGYWYVKKLSKCIIVDLEVYKKLYPNNILTKKN